MILVIMCKHEEIDLRSALHQKSPRKLLTRILGISSAAVHHSRHASRLKQDALPLPDIEHGIDKLRPLGQHGKGHRARKTRRHRRAEHTLAAEPPD